MSDRFNEMTHEERAALAKRLFDQATPEEAAQAMIVLDQEGALDTFLTVTGTDFEAACRRAGLFDPQPRKGERRPTVSIDELRAAETLSTPDLEKLLHVKGML